MDGQVIALTPKQQRFVDEFIVCGNGSEAARRAGYSERTAYQIAYENMRKPEIQAAIGAYKQAQAEKLELRREHIVAAILQAVEVAQSQSKAGPMISGWREIGKLCGFYDPVSLKAEKRQQQEPREVVRGMSSAELLSRVSEDGRFRNPDGSQMRPEQVGEFYTGLTNEELRALADGSGTVVTRVVIRGGVAQTAG
ncbi:MAG: terminase small subunit [Sulfuritalea sp.]|nr:terminase small subunit [Sulfuritalea sp.]